MTKNKLFNKLFKLIGDTKSVEEILNTYLEMLCDVNEIIYKDFPESHDMEEMITAIVAFKLRKLGELK